MRIKPFVILGALGLVLAACTSSPQPTASPSDITPSSSASASATASAGDLSAYTVTGAMGQKPTVTIAKGAGNVSNLLVKDIVTGTGAAVQATDNVTVNYVGIGAISRKQFDASWDAKTTASFPLSGVILGWQQGLVGMKVGGRRRLTIPPHLGYGDQGVPGVIPPGAMLTAEITILRATLA